MAGRGDSKGHPSPPVVRFERAIDLVIIVWRQKQPSVVVVDGGFVGHLKRGSDRS